MRWRTITTGFNSTYMIHHCNAFVLVCHFVEKWIYKFSLMIKGENVGVNTGDHQSKLVSHHF